MDSALGFLMGVLTGASAMSWFARYLRCDNCCQKAEQ